MILGFPRFLSMKEIIKNRRGNLCMFNDSGFPTLPSPLRNSWKMYGNLIIFNASGFPTLPPPLRKSWKRFAMEATLEFSVIVPEPVFGGAPSRWSSGLPPGPPYSCLLAGFPLWLNVSEKPCNKGAGRPSKNVGFLERQIPPDVNGVAGTAPNTRSGTITRRLTM